jgi:hypothetical protein
MLGFWLLLGQVGQGPRPGATPELLWTLLALAGILLLGIAAILWVKRWRAGLDQARESPEEQLARYRSGLAQGEITLEEFERITGVLRGRLPPRPKVPPEPTGNGEPQPADPSGV